VKDRSLSPIAIAGLVTAVVGFFLNISYHTSKTVNGVQTDCDYRDFGGLLVGPAAIVLGVLAIARAGRPGHHPTRELIVGVVCLALGAVHLLRGLGILDIDLTGSNPC
jgi:hypothetical protein